MEDFSVYSVYRSVIDDVILRVKPEFVQEGVDEAVLDELRLLWEKKLQESGVLEPPQQQGHGSAQPLAVTQLPPLPPFLSALPGVPQTLPFNQQYPAAAPTSSYNALAGQPVQCLNHSAPKKEQQYASLGQTAPANQQPSSAPHSTGTFTAQHIFEPARYESTAAEPSAVAQMQRQAVSQIQAGPSQQQQTWDDPSRKRKTEEERDALSRHQRQHLGPPQGPQNSLGHIIPQQDGADDDDGGDEDEADKEDNLSDVSSENEEDEQCPDVVIAQFDKVTHTKAKWRCQLKDGVMNIDGRDFLFHTANGEMQF